MRRSPGGAGWFLEIRQPIVVLVEHLLVLAPPSVVFRRQRVDCFGEPFDLPFEPPEAHRHPRFERIEPGVDAGKPRIDRVEPDIDGGEASIDLLELRRNGTEPGRRSPFRLPEPSIESLLKFLEAPLEPTFGL